MLARLVSLAFKTHSRESHTPLSPFILSGQRLFQPFVIFRRVVHSKRRHVTRSLGEISERCKDTRSLQSFLFLFSFSPPPPVSVQADT